MSAESIVKGIVVAGLIGGLVIVSGAALVAATADEPIPVPRRNPKPVPRPRTRQRVRAPA